MKEGKSDDAPGSDEPYRRKFERLPFRFPVTLRLESGRMIRGESRDVAVRGLFLATTEKLDGVEQGMGGVILLEIHGERREFHCQVAHKRAEGLGIFIDRGSENFGFTLTNAIFGEASLNLGAGVGRGGELQLTVTAPDRTAYSVRVVKVSTQSLEFCIPKGRRGLGVGQRVALVLREPGATSPVGLKGIVTGLAPPLSGTECAGSEAHCVVRLDPMGELEARRIKDLVLHHHRQNLESMMQRRAMANTLLSGGDTPRPGTREVRSDLQRFFPRGENR